MADTLPPLLRDAIASIAADTGSGATALVLRGIDVLAEAAGSPPGLAAVAAALTRAQPAMAGFRTAAALALAAENPQEDMARLAGRIRRAPRDIARLAAPLISLRRPTSAPLTVVTISHSGLVEGTLAALANAAPLRVYCAESRPGGEGFAFARALRDHGAAATVFEDTAIGAEIERADAVVVGADAVTAGEFVNKSGTAGLAALAHLHGVPLVVLAGREKVVPRAVLASMAVDASRTVGSGSGVLHTRVFERVRGVGATVVSEGGTVELGAAESMTLWSNRIYECYERMLCA